MPLVLLNVAQQAPFSSKVSGLRGLHKPVLPAARPDGDYSARLWRQVFMRFPRAFWWLGAFRRRSKRGSISAFAIARCCDRRDVHFIAVLPQLEQIATGVESEFLGMFG